MILEIPDMSEILQFIILEVLVKKICTCVGHIWKMEYMKKIQRT